jgi:hypothetical protein
MIKMNLPINNDLDWKATTHYGYTMSVGNLEVTFTPRALHDARTAGVEKSSTLNPFRKSRSYFKANIFILWRWLFRPLEQWTVFTARDSGDNVISIGCGFTTGDPRRDPKLLVERLFYYEIPE